MNSAVVNRCAAGRLPGFRVDRAGAALSEAGLMMALAALSLDEAYKAIDFNTITRSR